MPGLSTTIAALLLAAALLSLSSPARAVPGCPDCGGKTPVPYPLSTAHTCGDQSYKVRCDAATATLHFDTLNNTYPITSVDPTSQRLVIAPSPFLPNVCVTSDLPDHGVQLNASSPFNITSSNTILYLNCSNLLLSSPLNCSSASLCHVYVDNAASGSSVAACGKSGNASASSSSPMVCCTFQAGGSATSYQVRVRTEGCSAYTSFVNLDPSQPVRLWPKPGLEIQWVLPREPVCGTQSDCDDGGKSNSTCAADPTESGVRRCFCNAGLTWDPTQGVCIENVTCKDPGGCGTNNTPLIAGLTSGIGAALLATVLVLLLYRRHRRIKEAQDRLAREREEILNASGGRSAKLFTGREMKKAAGNFSKDRLLGAGGYGEVYKGILDDGTVVAIKCAKLGNTKGTDQVLNEVRILCQVNHRSLVRLLGCCVELEQPLLVYEYIENGTLSDHLRGGGRGKLSWNSRLQIAHDTAEGLAYLHSSAVPPIYHRDVKSSNILLDKKLNAKVSDFGLSRLAHTDMSHVSTCAQGTLGYLDPEYYRNYQLTDKSDVYSFGVVLLELLTSQKAIDFNREADDVNLSVYVQRMVEEERIMDVVDPILKEKASNIEVDTMKALGFLAIGCLEERRQNRPSMKEVAEEIAYIMSIATAEVAGS